MHKDELDGKGGDFRNEDTTERIGKGGVNADEGEGSIERFVLEEFDSEILGTEKLSTKAIGFRKGVGCGHLFEFFQTP